MNLGKFFYNFKFLIKAKWHFRLPQNKKILIIDGNINPFGRYFKDKDINILYRRGEEINIAILLLCIINFNLTPLGYYKQFIKFSKPKIILTACDHYAILFQLSELTKIKTAFVQTGKRTLMDGPFLINEIANKKNKKKFFIDYLFLHNKHVGKIYNSFTKGKVVEIGSFYNNVEKKIIKNKKKEILFISNYKFDLLENKRRIKNFSYKGDAFDMKLFNKNDKYIIKCLSDFSYKKSLKLNILGRQSGENSKPEKKYYDDIINNQYNFIPRDRVKNSYKTMEQFEFVFTTWSTLGIENLVKNGKTGFIFNKPKVKNWITARTGHLEKLNYKGPFWTTTTANNKKEFNRVFNFVIKGNSKTWQKMRKKYGSELMAYDRGNTKFLKIVNKCIN